jgi:tRNA(adenine34) deaminase
LPVQHVNGSFLVAQTDPFANLDHSRFMRLAIEQARKNPRYPFGAVLIDGTTERVLAEGINRVTESPIFHGEMDAINNCAHNNPQIDWNKLILYTTAEPCPMCQSAIVFAGIRLTVFGTSIPYLMKVGWRQIEIRADEVLRRSLFSQSVLLGGVLEGECNALFNAAQQLLCHEGR